MTSVPTTDVIVGVTHLLVDEELTPLLKCPFCNFRNIHEDTITHHIRFTDDSQHKDVDIEQLDKIRYIVTRVSVSPYGPYLSSFNDQVINQINYNRELFDFLKKIFPGARAIPKSEYSYRNKSSSDKPKLKASVIICPIPECNYRCVEHQEPLSELFLRHLKKVHHIIPRAKFVENLKGKISYLRNNDRISYIDPFVHVQRTDLF